MKFYTVDFFSDEKPTIKGWGYFARFLSHTASYPDLPFDRMHEDTFKLKAKATAKITDFLITAIGTYEGLLFNDKVKNIFKNFNIPNYFRYFDLTVEHKSGIYNYHWLLTKALSEDESVIDFSRTKFCLNFNHETNRFEKIGSFKNYQEAIDVNAHLRDQAELWLTKTAWQYDIIILPRIGIGEYNIILSEKLGNALIKNKVTGIKIIKADWIHAVD